MQYIAIAVFLVLGGPAIKHLFNDRFVKISVVYSHDVHLLPNAL